MPRSICLLLLLAPAACGAEVSFEPNLGQAGGSVSFFTRSAGGAIFFAPDGAVSLSSDGKIGFELAGANPHARWEVSEPTGQTTSYYIGRDRSRWHKDVTHYRRLTRPNVYEGIDVSFYNSAGFLEYDFLLAPNADPARIRLRLRGARKLQITADGDLVIETEAGKARHHKPIVFETLPNGSRRAVDSEFKIVGRREVCFAVGTHDRSLSLSIDPVLELSTYFGGSGDDTIVATSGSTVVGTTTSVDVPAASFARRKGKDIFVQSSPTQTLVFGGSGDDQVTSVSLNAGSILIGGYTNSTDLPTGVLLGKEINRQGAWQTQYAGGASDGFLLYLSINNIGQYAFMSYIGTPGEDRITGVSTSGLLFAAVGITDGHGLALPSPPAFDAPFQADLGGGLDGFFLAGSFSTSSAGGSTSGSETLVGITYLGGSLDDTLLAVIASTSGYYMTGETKSADFPLTAGYSSQRNGDSDAFVARITITNGVFTLDRATLFGGSGSERGAALALLTNGSLLVAGSTSSPDLPLAKPIQLSYGGGASDAFLAQFTPDLSRLSASTYYGGSGDEEATAVTADLLGNVFLAGWTSSTDFPVRNALQPQFGGGPDDAFLLHFDTNGSLYQATYFGGSGSDRALSLFAAGGPTVWIAGSTTSPDLPLQGASQTALAGPSDGWMARVSASLIQAPDIIGGKDLRVSVPLTLGNAATASSTTITVTSSDPDKVVVAGDLYQLGQPFIQIAFSPLVPGSVLYADCLVDTGGASLTLSAAGYPDRLVHVSCFQPSVQIMGVVFNGFSIVESAHTNPWAPPLQVSFSLLAANPSDPSQTNSSATLQPESQPIIAQITNSNPRIGTVSSSLVSLGVPGRGLNSASPPTPISFTPLAEGQTTISVTSPLLAVTPSSKLTITVDPPVNIASPGIAIPGGFQTLVILNNGLPPPAGGSVTVTSLDPSLLVLSTDPTQQGSASVSTPPFGRGIYAQALASSGDATITIASTGQDTVSAVIHLSSPVALLSAASGPPQSLALAVGQTVPVTASIGVADGKRSPYGYSPNPGGDPVRFALSASDPAPLSISPAVAQLSASGASPSVTFQVQALAEGTPTLSLQSLNSIAVGDPINVTVKTQPLMMADIEVGKYLAAPMTLVLPPVRSPGVTVTSSNSSLVLLSADGRTPGQASLNLPNSGSGSLSFYVYGLASAGQAQVTATVAPIGSVTATVQLDPSGYGWSVDHYALPLYGANAPTPTIVPFALDPASGAPVASQGLLPGIFPGVIVSSTNPDVATAVVIQHFDGASSITLLQINSRSPGDTVFSFQQPTGFTTPATHQQLALKILNPTLALYPIVLGRNMQVPLQTTLPRNGPTIPLTVTSSDPSKVLVSADPNAVGSASVTSFGEIYIQGLDSAGSVTLTGSAPNFNDSVVTVDLTPSGVGLTVTPDYFNTTVNGQSVTTTTTQAFKTSVRASFYFLGSSVTTPLRPRAGLGPVMVNFTSSNPAVGVVSGSPVQMPLDGTAASVDFTPLSPGTTNVTVTQPPGFTDSAGLGTLVFNVK